MDTQKEGTLAKYDKQFQKAEAIQQQINDIKISKATGKRKSPWSQADVDNIAKLLEELAQVSAQLPELEDDKEGKGMRPDSKIEYGTHTTSQVGGMAGDSVDGAWVEATALSIYSTQHKGNPRTHSSNLTKSLKNLRGIAITPAHLLNHHIPGDGTKPGNIIPVPNAVNKNMPVEGILKGLILSKNKVVYYKAKVTWPINFNRGGATEEDNRVPENISFVVQELTLKTGITKDADKKKQENWERIGKKHSVKPVKMEPIKTALRASKFEELKSKIEDDIEKYPIWRDYRNAKKLSRDLSSGKLSQEDINKLKQLFEQAKNS